MLNDISQSWWFIATTLFEMYICCTVVRATCFWRVSRHPFVFLCVTFLFCSPHVFDHCAAFFISHLHRVYSDVATRCNAKIQFAEEKLLARRITPINIRYYFIYNKRLCTLFARKGHLQKALALKWMQMTMCISWYTRRPRNEAISISFIMQLLFRISFRSFSRQKDILSRSVLFELNNTIQNWIKLYNTFDHSLETLILRAY